jgi:hypothetical protein
VAELDAARKSCLGEGWKGNRTRQEYNINVILVIKPIIIANIQWHACNKSYDCPCRNAMTATTVVAFCPLGKLVFFNARVFVVNLQHY